jgi:hypothetical protein
MVVSWTFTEMKTLFGPDPSRKKTQDSTERANDSEYIFESRAFPGRSEDHNTGH